MRVGKPLASLTVVINLVIKQESHQMVLLVRSHQSRQTVQNLNSPQGVAGGAHPPQFCIAT